MSKKIVVPEEMKKAAIDDWYIRGRELSIEDRVDSVLRAALGWLADNPIVPSSIDVTEMVEARAAFDRPPIAPFFYAVEWQRRMFLAPEPEVPKVSDEEREIIDAWLKRYQKNGQRVGLVGNAMAGDLIQELEAYRRGREGK